MNLLRRLSRYRALGVLVACVGLVGLGLAPWIPFATTLERFVPPEERGRAEDMLLMVSLSRPEVSGKGTGTVRSVFGAIRDHPGVEEGLDPVVAASRAGLPLPALWSGLAIPGGQGFQVANLPLVRESGRVLNGLYRISPAYRDGIRLLEDMEAVRDRRVPDTWTFSMAGLPVINGWLAREARALQSRLIPLLVLLMVGVLFLLYRSGRILLVLGGTVVAAVGWTFAIMYVLGFPHDLLSVLPPMLVMVITVSGTVHVLSELAATEGTVETRLEHALERKGPPAFFCHLSTAVGFGSLALSRMPSVRALGTVSALGIAGMSLVLFSVFPLLLRVCAPEAKRCRVSLPVPGWLLRVVSTPSLCGALMLVAAGLLAAGGLRYPSLRYESRAMMYFSPEHRLRTDIDRLSRDFLPPRHDLVRVHWEDAPPSEFKRGVWSVRLSHIPGVERVVTGPRLEAADLLPGKNGKGTGAFVFYSTEVLNDLSEVRNRIVERTRTSFPGLKNVSFEGVLDQVDRVQKELQRTLQISMMAAAALIFLMLAGIVRDGWQATGGMLANLLPLAGVVLLVDVSRVPLDAGMILIFSVTLGLALDDTLHYLYEHRSGGEGPAGSVRRVYAPLVVTTLVLSSGIGVFSFASFRPVAHFGSFAAAGLVFALVTDLVFLPALFTLTES